MSNEKVRRVLYVNAPTYLGGAELSLLSLMTNLDAERYRAALLTTNVGRLSQAASRQNLPVHLNHLLGANFVFPGSHIAAIIRFVALLRRWRVSLIHTNCELGLVHTRYAAQITHTPYVSHVRDFVRDWFTPANLRVLCSAHAVIANSNAVAQTCREAGIPSERISTIYNPVDIHSFTDTALAERPRVRNELGIPMDATLVGAVGQMQPIKGLREFITTALRLADVLPNVHFAIVGEATGDQDDRFASEIRSLTSQSPHGKRFHYTGFRTDIPAMMSAIDILAVPSWNEPFGRVVVEGMAAGCIVIGTQAGGIPEIITHGTDGLLVPPRNPDALLQTLLKVLQDTPLQRKLHSQAPLSAQRFAVHSHVEQMQLLYDSTLTNR